MIKQLITVGHSPDPDDAFMFYALAHDKLDTGNLQFRHELQDIETLNRRALRGELEVTAVSIHAYAHLLDKYALLPSVAEGRYDAGLIIHEGQLTFQNMGLHLVVDLGVWWQERTGLPLPLGGNVVRRDLGQETVQQISQLLKESIQYG